MGDNGKALIKVIGANTRFGLCESHNHPASFGCPNSLHQVAVNEQIGSEVMLVLLLPEEVLGDERWDQVHKDISNLVLGITGMVHQSQGEGPAWLGQILKDMLEQIPQECIENVRPIPLDPNGNSPN